MRVCVYASASAQLRLYSPRARARWLPRPGIPNSQKLRAGGKCRRHRHHRGPVATAPRASPSCCAKAGGPLGDGLPSPPLPPTRMRMPALPQARAAAPAQSPLRKSNSRRRDRAGVLWMNHRPGMVHLIYMNIQGGSAFACNSQCTAPTVTGYIATALASTVSYLPFTASNTALDLPGITNIAICILDMLVAQGGCIMCNPPAIRTTVAMGAAPRLGARLV